jgi:hypothetical protein
MKKVVVVVGIILLFSSCNKSVEPPDVKNYPLTAGSVWNYDGRFETFNFRPLNDSATFRDTVIERTLRVECIGNVVLRDSVSTIKFISTQSDFVGTSSHYYVLQQDTLFQYAYGRIGGSIIMPKQHAKYKYHIAGLTFSSLQDAVRFFEESIEQFADSIIFDVRPPKTLVFPLKVGLEWSYRKRGYPFGIEKKVIGTENLTTPQGIFSVYKIQWFWDINNDGIRDTTISGFDYVGNQGLLKRTFLFTAFAVTVDDPAPIGYVDAKDEFTITSFDIQ